MDSLPPTPLPDIDTLPDGAVITDEDIDASASASASDAPAAFAELPVRKPFDQEPTRKAHAPRPPRPRESTDVVDVSSWDSRKKSDA